jgi:hypothetical protein
MSPNEKPASDVPPPADRVPRDNQVPSPDDPGFLGGGMSGGSGATGGRPRSGRADAGAFGDVGGFRPGGAGLSPRPWVACYGDAMVRRHRSNLAVNGIAWGLLVFGLGVPLLLLSPSMVLSDSVCSWHHERVPSRELQDPAGTIARYELPGTWTDVGGETLTCSPDGRYLAFSVRSTSGGPDDMQAQLQVLDFSDEVGARMILTTQPVAYRGSGGNGRPLEFDWFEPAWWTTESELITSCFGPNHTACSWVPGGLLTVILQPAAAAMSTPVLARPGPSGARLDEFGSLEWWGYAADGSRFSVNAVEATRCELRRLRPGASEYEILARDVTCQAPRISADGEWVAWVDMDSAAPGAALFHVEDASIVPVPGWVEDIAPCIGEHGERRVVVATTVYLGHPLFASDIALVDLSTSAPVSAHAR